MSDEDKKILFNIEKILVKMNLDFLAHDKRMGIRLDQIDEKILDLNNRLEVLEKIVLD